MKFFTLIALVATASAVKVAWTPTDKESKDEHDIRVNRETFAAENSGLHNTAYKTPREKEIITRAEAQHAAQPGAGMNVGAVVGI